MFRHLVLASIVDNLQVNGQIQNIEAGLENVEIHAFKELNKLKGDIAKHKWNRIS